MENKVVRGQQRRRVVWEPCPQQKLIYALAKRVAANRRLPRLPLQAFPFSLAAL